ncbi:CoA transferase [Marinomonas fungiae]|uniref:Dimethylsulfoniopropionate cleavage enzyme DddD n=1 Tax=Marinomonas fungiae TaxID=1137284 RepID=A0A0K6IN14_9GAMM|nr:CoA transferase [Marinomonas fungiae]CUB04494.1 dimethylsulfoniopropionate cleavage enzyme DddD [Marinomonas fungiae]
MNNNNQLPLIGVRVVDFGQQIAAPAVAMILADLGATVIHVDPPQGPQWVSPANAVLNRNKQCINLNLKSEAGLNQARQLIDQADIVIENFRPGVLARLGIDFEELRAKRPELITLSIPGFASNDMLRREWKATEAIIAATSGSFTDMGFNRVLMGIEPSFSPVPLGSSYAISLAAGSVVMALYERAQSGQGDHIEVPVAAALMEGLSYNSFVIDQLPERYKTMREHEIAYRRENNIEMDLTYEELQEYLDPFFRTYDCADGRKFYCVCPSHRNHAKRALQALGVYDELMAEGFPEVQDLHAPIHEWDGETSLGVYPLPEKWAKIVSAKMKKAFLTKSAEEWHRIFGEVGIPGASQRTTKEWLHDEHTNQAGLIIEVDDPEYGLMKQPGPLVWFEHNAAAFMQAKGREFVDFETALHSLSSTTPPFKLNAPQKNIASNPVQKGWLAGKKVLDLTNVIAGPHSAAYLGRFGVDVIKLDPVTPLYDPLIGCLYSFQTDMGKKKALVNIMTEKGREVLNRLIKSVDLVLINAPERQLASLGLDSKSLLEVNPNVLFCRLDCFGGPLRGPKTDYIGYDDIIQANSGIMMRFGGSETPEEHAHVGTLDVNCGFAAGMGMALSMYHQLVTGQVSRVRTSLSAVTNMAQIPFMFDYQGREPFNEASGREVLGNHPLSHFYETMDGWIFLDSDQNEFEKLKSLEGLTELGDTPDLHAYLKHAFKQAATSHWLNLLRGADVAVAEPNSIETLRHDYSRIHDGEVGTHFGSYAFSIYPDHPSGHCFTQIDHYSIRPSRAAIRAIAPTEKFGNSTKEILASVGYSETEIADMIEANIASLGWSKEYLPS